jgi:hypothetical protein
MVVDKIVEIRGEIKKDFSEEFGEKYKQFFDQITSFAETVTQGNIELKSQIEEL